MVFVVIGLPCEYVAQRSSLHIPLVMSWPEAWKRDVITDAMVELVDLAPTLLESAGLPIPEEMTGRSLIVRL